MGTSVVLMALTVIQNPSTRVDDDRPRGLASRFCVWHWNRLDARHGNRIETKPNQSCVQFLIYWFFCCRGPVLEKWIAEPWIVEWRRKVYGY